MPRLAIFALSLLVLCNRPAAALDLFATHEVTVQFATEDGKYMLELEFTPQVARLTLAASPLFIFGAGPIGGLGVAGAAWAVVGYNVAMAAVLMRAVWAAGSPTRPSSRALVPRWRYALEILRVAVPSAANTLVAWGYDRSDLPSIACHPEVPSRSRPAISST